MLDVAGLSPCERKMLPLIASGLRNRDIAAELGLGEDTVKAHVRSILRKTGLPRRAAVAGAAAGSPAGARDMIGLVRRVAPDVVRIAAAEAAGHITSPEADKLIEGLVSVAA